MSKTLICENYIDKGEETIPFEEIENMQEQIAAMLDGAMRNIGFKKAEKSDKKQS